MDKFDEKVRETTLPGYDFTPQQAIAIRKCIAQFGRDVARETREEDAQTVLASGLLDAQSAFMLAEIIRSAKEVMPTESAEAISQATGGSVTLPGVESPQGGGSGQPQSSESACGERGTPPVTARMIVCQFSCGAASAVATKITLARHGHEITRIVNAYVAEEDADNRRFLADCEKWFDHEVVVVQNQKYHASAREVWRKERYIKGPLGASCSMRLKREPISEYMDSIGWNYDLGDRMVVGFVVDEKNQGRIVRGRTAGWLLPCVDMNLSHADCRGMVLRAGIKLPKRYDQGFETNNCVACCKGGERYFRRERRLNPQDVAEVVQIQKDIGPNAYFFLNRETGVRFTPEEIPDDGPVTNADAPECSFFCAMAEEEIA